jgi:hypothetical protein
MKPLLFLKNGYVKAAWPLNFPIRRNGPGAHGGVAMAQRAFLPDLAHGPRRHLPGRQGGVFLGIPL